MNNTDKYESMKRVFLHAYELIQKGWTQNAMARDEYGNAVDHRFPNAVCFCSVGAIHRARHDLLNTLSDAHMFTNYDLLDEFSSYLAKRTSGTDLAFLASFNDTNRKENVLAVWKQFGQAKGYLV